MDVAACQPFGQRVDQLSHSASRCDKQTVLRTAGLALGTTFRASPPGSPDQASVLTFHLHELGKSSLHAQPLRITHVDAAGQRLDESLQCFSTEPAAGEVGQAFILRRLTAWNHIFRGQAQLAGPA